MTSSLLFFLRKRELETALRSAKQEISNYQSRAAAVLAEKDERIDQLNSVR